MPTSGGIAIPVSTLGSAGSPLQIVAGPYEDLSLPSPSTTLITCTSTDAPSTSLTGCTVAGGSSVLVNQGDDLVQVIATANLGIGQTYERPVGPNTPTAAAAWERSRSGNRLQRCPERDVGLPLTTLAILNLNAAQPPAHRRRHRVLRAVKRQPDEQDRELHHAAGRRPDRAPGQQYN